MYDMLLYVYQFYSTIQRCNRYWNQESTMSLKKQDLLNKHLQIPTTFITESLINNSSANNSNSDVAQCRSPKLNTPPCKILICPCTYIMNKKKRQLNKSPDMLNIFFSKQIKIKREHGAQYEGKTGRKLNIFLRMKEFIRMESKYRQKTFYQK